MCSVQVHLNDLGLGVSLTAILSDELPPERSKGLLGQLIEGYASSRRRTCVSRSVCRRRFAYRMGGGDEGTRTPDPCDANAVLSQLSYIPTGA